MDSASFHETNLKRKVDESLKLDFHPDASKTHKEKEAQREDLTSCSSTKRPRIASNPSCFLCARNGQHFEANDQASLLQHMKNEHKVKIVKPISLGPNCRSGAILSKVKEPSSHSIESNDITKGQDESSTMSNLTNLDSTSPDTPIVNSNLDNMASTILSNKDNYQSITIQLQEVSNSSHSAIESSSVDNDSSKSTSMQMDTTETPVHNTCTTNVIYQPHVISKPSCDQGTSEDITVNSYLEEEDVANINAATNANPALQYAGTDTRLEVVEVEVVGNNVNKSTAVNNLETTSESVAVSTNTKATHSAVHTRIHSNASSSSSRTILVFSPTRTVESSSPKNLQSKIERNILSIACMRCKRTYSSTKEQDPTVLQCSACRWTFQSPVHLRCHFDHFHADDVKCPLCPYTLKKGGITVMDQHLKSEHPNAKIFHCYLCEMEFNRKACLYNHVQRHFKKGGEFECPHCHMRFEQERSVNVHVVKAHAMLLGYPQAGQVDATEKTTYMCGVCGRQYAYAGTLNMHLKKHQLDSELEEQNEELLLQINQQLKEKQIAYTSKSNNERTIVQGTQHRLRDNVNQNVELVSGQVNFLASNVPPSIGPTEQIQEVNIKTEATLPPHNVQHFQNVSFADVTNISQEEFGNNEEDQNTVEFNNQQSEYQILPETHGIELATE